MKLSKKLNMFAFGGGLGLGKFLNPKKPMADYGAQLEADKQNALFNFRLNNQRSNPFGSQSVESDGQGGYRTVTRYAEPIQQAITGNLGLLGGAQKRISDTLAQPAFDASSLGARDEIIKALMSRMNFGADEESLRQRLANQGLTPGSEAWSKEMGQLGQRENDARMRAILGSGDEMQRLFELNQAARIAPMQEMSALMETTQGLAPEFGFQGQNASLTNPVEQQYQEQLDRYNARIARRDQLLGQLFNMGSAAVSGGMR